MINRVEGNHIRSLLYKICMYTWQEHPQVADLESNIGETSRESTPADFAYFTFMSDWSNQRAIKMYVDPQQGYKLKRWWVNQFSDCEYIIILYMYMRIILIYL